MRKLYLFLALLLTFSSSAWADFHQPWTSTPFPWTATKQAGDLPSGITVPTGISDIEYRMGSVAVTRTGGTGDVTINFHYLDGGHALQILGVDLVDASSNVISDYTARSARGNNQDALFTLSNVPEGSYTLRYWVYSSPSNSNNLKNTNGTITVTGLNSNYITSLDDLSNDKVYYFKSGRSSGSTSHYLYYKSDADNYLASTQKYSTIFDANSDIFHFALYKSGDTYYMYNIAAGKFVGNSSENFKNIPLVKFPSNGIAIKPSGDMNYNWMLSTNGFANGTLHMSGSTDYGVTNWTSGNSSMADGGNTYQIYEAGDLSSDLQAAFPDWISWGPGYNQVKNDFEAASDTRVGSITLASRETINSALTTFETSPTSDNYTAMVNARTAATRVSLNAGEKFTIQCVESSRGYMVYSTVEGKGSETTVNLAIKDNQNYPGLTEEGVYKEWAFVEKNGKKYIYNVENQKFIKKGTPVTFVEVGTFVEFNDIGNALFNIKFEGKNQYLSFSPGWGLNNCVRTEGSADNGCKFYLDKTGETDSNLSTLFTKLHKGDLDEKLAKGRLLGTGVGKYTYSGSEAATTVIANAEATLASTTSTNDDITDAMSALEAIYADFTINQPVADKLYRFKGHASNNYICPANTETGQDKFMAMNANNEHAATVFMLVEGSEGKFKLLNYGFGYYTTQTYCCGANKANANNIQFAESTTYPGYYTMKSDASGVGTWLYDHNSKVNRNTDYVANNCDWKIEEVEYLPIPVSNVYRFGTFTSPVDLAITDTWYAKDARMKFYIAEVDPADDYVVLTQVNKNIPANHSYVIEYIEGSDYKNGCSFMKIADSAPAIDGTNALRGRFETVAKPTNEGTIYTLQAAWINENTVSADEVAFRQYNGETIKGFRAYLPVTGNTRIAGMRINDGETTLIEGVQAEQSHKVDVYDLSGRRVQRAHKGLYIINGKKVIVK